MMAAELRAAIDLLSTRDPTVYASLMAGRRQGLSEVDTLAQTVLHLATAKAELEAELLKRAMEAPPRVLVGPMLTGHADDGGEPRQWFTIIKAGPTTTTYKCWTDNLFEFDMELRHGTPGHLAMGKLAPSSRSPFSVEWQS